MVEVPSLVGKSLDAAQKVLEDLHLPAGKISFEQKPNVAENIVLEQFPKPGKKVEGTAEISLVVSEAQVTSATKGQPPPPRVSNPHPVTPQSVWAVGDQGTILRTEDGGGSWKPGSTGTNYPLYYLTFATHQSGWAVGGKPPTCIILRTEDGGSSWKPQTNGNKAALYSVAFVTPQLAWAVGYGGSILHTEDGGGSWKPQTSGSSGWLRSVAFATPKSGWAVGGVDPKFGASKAIILHTEDGGSTWKGQTSGTTAFLNSVAFAKPR